MAAPAAAIADDAKSRISRLENEVQTLSRAIFRGEAPPAGFGAMAGQDAANMEVRLQQLETQIRELTGKVEEQNHQTGQLKAQLEKMAADLELRFSDLSGGARYTATPQQQPYQNSYANPPQPHAGAYPPPTQPRSGGFTWSSKAGEQAPALGTLNETMPASGDAAAAAYESAFSMLKSGNYFQAERAFESFLGQYPDHALAGNAQYWLGESYYARADYESASRSFAQAYKAQPKGPKAADNLLKLGMSLAGLGKKNDACVALGQVEKEFSNEAGPVLRRAQEEMSRVGC